MTYEKTLKSVVVILYILLSGGLSLSGFAGDVWLNKVGEWSRGDFNDVHLQGNYVYCASGYGGLDILDITNPEKPVHVGNYNTPGSAEGIYVTGNYAYLADGTEGLHIIDISNPRSPLLVSNFNGAGDLKTMDVHVKENFAYVNIWSVYGNGPVYVIDVSRPGTPALVAELGVRGNSIFISGHYAYVTCSNYVPGRTDTVMGGMEGFLHIIDVSVPTRPVEISRYMVWEGISRVYVKSNYAYLIEQGSMHSTDKLRILDVSNPAAPVDVGHYETSGTNIFVSGDLAFVTGGEKALQIFDVSNPANPTLVEIYKEKGNKIDSAGIYAADNYVYTACKEDGLKIIEISTPSSPKLTYTFDRYTASHNIHKIYVNGQYGYITNSSRLEIMDLSHPQAPLLLSSYKAAETINHAHVTENYAFLATRSGEFQVLDVSAPDAPRLVGTYAGTDHLNGVYINGNYAYVAADKSGLLILDVSVFSSITLETNYNYGGETNDVFARDSYAYLADDDAGLIVLDISTPSNPVKIAEIKTAASAYQVNVQGNYAYVGTSKNIEIFDISNPAAPVSIPISPVLENKNDFFIKGDYLFTVSYDRLEIFDMSILSSPVLAAEYLTTGVDTDLVMGLFVHDNNIYLTAGDLLIFKFGPGSPSSLPPRIQLNREALYFAAEIDGPASNVQTVLISNTGEGQLNWTACAGQDWLGCSPSSGSFDGRLFVSVDHRKLPVGTYKSALNITDPNAENSPQTIRVTLEVYSNNRTALPFGTFATPGEGAVVSGNVPFTGWALDDVEVISVQLFQEEGTLLVYIGDAVFVEEARPDVEQNYPGYPNNYRAGWGYMLLTHFLAGGNGIFTIHAIATDREGHQVTLGTKTITVDNATAVKPFGTIDTPVQGGTASGSGFINWGWVLTPRPNMIPTDGSTITVWVDGVPLGQPVYNQYRADIAALFPNYNNSNGAVGYFYLNTTAYENGVHTIQWTAVDDAGNTDGIGSRYFMINNAGPAYRVQNDVSGIKSKYIDGASLLLLPENHNMQIYVKKGFKTNSLLQEVLKDDQNMNRVTMKELNRITIILADAPRSDCLYSGYMKVGNNLRPLPVGSTLDAERGIFYWQPGPGFLGRYHLVFVETTPAGEQTKRSLIVEIIPNTVKNLGAVNHDVNFSAKSVRAGARNR